MKNHYARFYPLFLLFFALLTGFATQAQVVVTASGGTPGPTTYATLKGAFDAVNAGTHQGAINMSVTGNTTETAVATLNANGNGPANYTAVSIKPAAGATPTITGNIANAALVKLNGSSNVTIDGSNNGTSTRNLTITNTNTTSSNVLLIGSIGTTPISNVILKNAVLINGTNTSTAVVAGDAGTLGNAGYFSNITVQNNDIQKAYIGLYLTAVTGTSSNSTTVSGNDLNATGANAIRSVGIYAQGVNGLTISNNNIGNFNPTSAEFDRAIWLATGTINTTISGNTITGMAYTGTSSYAPIGINVSSGVTNCNVTVSDNMISNFTSSGTGTTIGIYTYSTLSGLTINNNKISNIKNTNTTGFGSAGMILAAGLSNAAVKVYNNFVSDIASYGYNGYAIEDNGNGIVVDGGGGYDIDFNTIVLNTNQTLTTSNRASCLLITANVFSSGSINVRNNILANLQTMGNASSRLALSNQASTGSAVFGTINRNDYYATSGNLSINGTTISTTLAQVQTNLGGNANSISVFPNFVSATDLHLSNIGANIPLDNQGTPLTGITTDIDGDTRSSTTPDMGADEFSTCPAPSFTTQPAVTAVCEGSNTSFNIVATNTGSYQWQVNTGSGFSNITNNTIYGGATTANLTLTGVPLTYNGYIYRCQVLHSAGCTPTNSGTATLTVNPKPTALITPASSTSICAGSSVTLNANAGFTYQWLKGNMGITPPATNASYVANTAGSYTVVVTNSTTTCKDTSAAVNVIVNNPVSATKNITICNNQLPYTWNGQSVAAAGTAVATFTTPSLVTGCDSTTTLNLATNTVVTATVNIIRCANQMPYTWNGQTINSPGTAVATYTTPSSSGCDSTTTLNLTVNPVLTATKSLTICQNQLPYTWNGVVVNAGGATAATYTTSSLVTGCDSTTTLNLTVNPSPVVTATPAVLAICSGTATSIGLTSSITGSTFAWTVAQTGATGASAGSGASIAQTLTASGNTPGRVIYSITATANSCPSLVKLDTVTVNPKPAVVINPTAQTICSGSASSIALSSLVSGTTFAWTVAQSNVTGAAAGNGASIVQTVTATGSTSGTATYTITPTANTCAGPTATAVLTVTPIPAVPGTITGAAAPCIGSTQTYSVTSVTGASSYIWTIPTGWTGTSTTNSITVTVGSNNGNIAVQSSNTCGSSVAATKAVTAIPVVDPSIAITSNAPALLCSGTLVTFTATATNGGSAPIYQWKVNSSAAGTNSSTFAYIPANGDTITCTFTSNAPCVTGNQIVSNRIIMQVTPTVIPSLNIYVEENHICSDMPVTLLATPVNGGTTPVYQWKVNNTNTGTNSNSYSYTPANGDVVSCLMTSNAVCAAPVAILSNPVPMSIITVTHPSLSITASPAGNVANGQPVTFTANALQAGPGAQITWYKNGTYISGASGTSWTGIAGTSLFNGNNIQARLRSFSPCALPDTASSNTIKMSVGTTGIGNYTVPDDFKIYPNPTHNIVTMEGLQPGDVWSVYDVLGHQLIRQTAEQGSVNTIDLSPFAQGMYWIRFINTKEQHWQVKITKQ